MSDPVTPAPSSESQLAPLRVLIVDDHQQDYEFVRHLLQGVHLRGYDGVGCIWASDPVGARRRLTDDEFDVALVDFHLGPITGAELIRSLSGDEVSLPFILLSGDARREADEAATEAGADDYLLKDELTANMLERSIRHALKRQVISRELHGQRAAAEAAAQSKASFLATMSHEIRNPMSGVMGMSALLLETTLDEEQREYAEAIRKASGTLLSIVNDVLNISKIEAGGVELEAVDFNLPLLVRETVELLAERAHGKGVDLRCVVDPALPRYVCGDSSRIRQVLMNLVGNAVKFTTEGHVEVALSLGDPELDEQGAAIVRFEIRDTGVGIPAEGMAGLFDPYVQAEASTTRRFGGTGLGLAICKRLAELMGGVIGVDSEVGVGSTFHFTLPLADPAKKAALTPLETYRGRLALVVDHDLHRRSAVIAEVAACGLRTVGFGSGAAAGAFVRSGADPVDLVVVDCDLGGKGAAGLLTSIATVDDAPATILVGTPAKRRRAMDDGIPFDGYATKPIRPLRLRQAVERALRERDGDGQRSMSVVPPPPSTQPDTGLFRWAEPRVLVADDDVINQAVVRRSLERVGCEVVVVGDGQAALEALARRSFDVVFMDGRMPVMDGFEATRRQRAREAPGDRQVIVALTGNAGEGAQQECVAAGMDDYLVKPVTPAQLRDTLERWVERIKAVTPSPNSSRAAA